MLLWVGLDYWGFRHSAWNTYAKDFTGWLLGFGLSKYCRPGTRSVPLPQEPRHPAYAWLASNRPKVKGLLT